MTLIIQCICILCTHTHTHLDRWRHSKMTIYDETDVACRAGPNAWNQGWPCPCTCDVRVGFSNGPWRRPRHLTAEARCLSQIQTARVVRGDARRDGLLAEAFEGSMSSCVSKNHSQEFLSFQLTSTDYINYIVWFREWALCASHVEHKELLEHKNPKVSHSEKHGQFPRLDVDSTH